VNFQGWFYLFTTYTNCSKENYHNTLVFRSKNPTDFGDYTGDNHEDVVIATLHAHAPKSFATKENGISYQTYTVKGIIRVTE
jgi:beta-fructofuranosidase